MAKPKPREFNLKEQIAKIQNAGLFRPPEQEIDTNLSEEDQLAPLPERIKKILGILQSKPVKSTTMNYLIMYDIQNNKVRNLVSKYLLKNGCIRVQKSVFLVHSDHKKFDEIRDTLVEINEIYENNDSIILVPLNISDARSMKLIGKNVNIERIIDPPNTVFL
ncbi:CRISPR associated protein Cas2 [Algoriphagus alkaliphilus]|uniref:CRISPR-associated endoribonuclease Cas2 n=1 Tax=Algoriphagus alkaliphilus TaxID=279824 RepID=A0A1G5X3X4_9BACT|nr:CRISPR-associated endonuclease Cas2 [Algoriphagus alkaliphilus]SDA64477.1 CRISPR associated protein Cas2 [Algoriphagus alkaliphilus]